MEYVTKNTENYINNGILFHSMDFDQKDLHILDILKQNARFTTKQIAKKLNIPITTVHNRIKKLEKLEIIKNYTVNLDYKKLGKPIVSYILMTVMYILPNGTKIKQDEVAKRIRSLENVEEVNILTGGFDIMIKVRSKDIDELNDFVIKKLRAIEGVDKTQTMIVLSGF